MKSIRDIYKIGTGPSSSHTMGPEAAARNFIEEHDNLEYVKVILYGSLAKTGKGHGTDRALVQTFSPVICEVVFSDEDVSNLKHPNTMDIIVIENGIEKESQRYYSVGGGDIKIEGRENDKVEEEVYLENSFAEIKQFCQCSYINLIQYISMNEDEMMWVLWMRQI